MERSARPHFSKERWGFVSLPNLQHRTNENIDLRVENGFWNLKGVALNAPFTAVGYHLYPTSLCRLSSISYADDSKQSPRCLSGFLIRFLLFFLKQ
jgi:hypothetical protein